MRHDAFQCPLAGVVERELGDVEDCALVERVVVHSEHLLLRLDFLFHLILGGFEQCVEAAEHHHRENNVAVLSTHKDIAQAVVGDAPNK